MKFIKNMIFMALTLFVEINIFFDTGKAACTKFEEVLGFFVSDVWGGGWIGFCGTCCLISCSFGRIINKFL